VRLVEIEGAGHRLLQEHREQVVPEILAFVQEQERNAGHRGAPEGA
jgi:hypothetical protein